MPLFPSPLSLCSLCSLWLIPHRGVPIQQEETEQTEDRVPFPTAIELSELRQDRSADFSPLPAVLAGPERGGLKSALLNSMAVVPFSALPPVQPPGVRSKSNRKERKDRTELNREIRENRN